MLGEFTALSTGGSIRY